MTTQNYLIIESNVVTNICVWDGNIETWTPPTDSIQLIQETTLSMVWTKIIVDKKVTGYELTSVEGVGAIGFTWDGTVLTTNEPEPTVPVQPTASGVQPA